MKRYIVDTNLFIRYFTHDSETLYLLARSYLKDAEAGKCELILTLEVILEIEYILRVRYKVAKAEVIGKIVSLLKSSFLMIEDKDILLYAFSLYEKYSIDLVDLVVLAKSKAYSCEVLTFDKQLKKLSTSISS